MRLMKDKICEIPCNIKEVVYIDDTVKFLKVIKGKYMSMVHPLLRGEVSLFIPKCEGFPKVVYFGRKEDFRPFERKEPISAMLQENKLEKWVIKNSGIHDKSHC